MARQSAASFVSNARCVPFGRKLCEGDVVFCFLFFQMIPILLARKPPRRAGSVTMATISSREIRWVKVINIATKRKC